MRLCDLLGIKYPIIQAPMAGSDNAGLAAAACNAGILGSVGAQYKKPDEIAATIKEIREKTQRPFAVNLFALPALTPPSSDQIETARRALAFDYRQAGVEPPADDAVINQIPSDDQLEVVLAEKVPAFSFTLGVPSDKWIERFKAAGTILIGTATNLVEAQALAAAKVDAICVQGCEAGGHRGTFIGSYEDSMIGLMALIPLVVDAVDVPVIAAGGIVDGRGIAAAFALGADGVQMGTAFLAVNECPVHDNFKNTIVSDRANRTAITRVFSGGAARGITNEFMKKHSETDVLPFPFHNTLTRTVRNAANKCGDVENTNLWCGQAGSLARRSSASELVQSLKKETVTFIEELAEVRQAFGGEDGDMCKEPR